MEYKNLRMGTTVIFPVLYGCGTWSLALREEHRLRVFETRVLRICGPKREKITGIWIKLLYLSPDIIRTIKSRRVGWARHAAHTGAKRIHTRSWLERVLLEDLGVDGGIISNCKAML
jgi:hypothetical protein